MKNSDKMVYAAAWVAAYREAIRDRGLEFIGVSAEARATEETYLTLKRFRSLASEPKVKGISDGAIKTFTDFELPCSDDEPTE